METKNLTDFFKQFSPVEERGMGENLHTLDTDPAHTIAKLPTVPTPQRTTGPLSYTEPQLPTINRNPISWDTLARINALIKYGRCSLFVKNEGVYKQLVELHTPAPYLRATIAELNSMTKSAHIEPIIILHLWDNNVETCERVNALIRFGRVNCYSLFAEEMYTVVGLHPLPDGWIEHITPEAQHVHIVKRFFDPLYLRL